MTGLGFTGAPWLLWGEQTVEGKGRSREKVTALVQANDNGATTP